MLTIVAPHHFPNFVARNKFCFCVIYPKTCLYSLKLARQVVRWFSLSLLPSICHVIIKFSKPSFRIMRPRNFMSFSDTKYKYPSCCQSLEISFLSTHLFLCRWLCHVHRIKDGRIAEHIIYSKLARNNSHYVA